MLGCHTDIIYLQFNNHFMFKLIPAGLNHLSQTQPALADQIRDLIIDLGLYEFDIQALECSRFPAVLYFRFPITDYMQDADIAAMYRTLRAVENRFVASQFVSTYDPGAGIMDSFGALICLQSQLDEFVSQSDDSIVETACDLRNHLRHCADYILAKELNSIIG